MTSVETRPVGASPVVAPDPTGRLPARWRTGWQPVLGAAFLLVTVAAAVLLRLATSQAAPGESVGAAGDFRDTIYFPVRALLDGINPYDPAALRAYDPAIGQWFPLYGPLHLLLHLPLGLLSLDAAIWLYAGLTLVLTVVLARVSLGLADFGRPASVVLGMAALLLASNAGRANLVNLQPTIVIVLGAYLTLTAHRRPWVAAVGVALAFVKPQFGIPLTALLFATGGAGVAWRGLVVTAASSAPVLIRLIAIEGGIGGVLGAVIDNLRFAADEPIGNYQVSLTSAFNVGSTGVAFGVAAVIILAAAVVLRGRPPRTAAGLTVFLGSIVISLFHVTYDLLLLTWPTLLAAGAVAAGRRNRPDRALLGLLLLLFFNPLTAAFVIDLFPYSDVLSAVAALTLLATLAVAGHIERGPAGDITPKIP